jgi:hypothetical protein
MPSAFAKKVAVAWVSAGILRGKAAQTHIRDKATVKEVIEKFTCIHTVFAHQFRCEKHREPSTAFAP